MIVLDRILFIVIGNLRKFQNKNYD